MKARQHETPIINEIYNKNGLTSRTGQNYFYWPRYIIKELIDNALEEIEAPAIDITLKDYTLSIKDNGSGISEDRIYKIFGDISNFSSTKRHYQLPTRGNQGNALLTILGIQYVLNQNKPLKVTSNSTEYNILINNSFNPSITKTELDNSIEGFKVELDIKQLSKDLGETFLKDQIEKTFYNFIGLNPQATISLTLDDTRLTFKSNENIDIPKLNLADSNTTGKVIWFDIDSFKQRLKADVQAIPKLRLKDFIAEFLGLASNRKVKAVINNLSYEVETIGDIDLNSFYPEELYKAMKKETKTFSSRGLDKSLGSIGEEGLKYCLIESTKSSDEYSKIEDILNKLNDRVNESLELDDMMTYYNKSMVKEVEGKVIPAFFEMVTIPTTDRKEDIFDSNIIFGINQSFIYSIPAKSFEFKDHNGKLRNKSLKGAFDDLEYNYKVICNLTCPNLEFTDKGKQGFNINDFEDIISEVLAKSYKKIKREVIRNLNKLGKEKEHLEDLNLNHKAPRDVFKRFVFKFFDEVYKKATNNGQYTITQRQLFYAMRPEFYKWCKAKGWKYKYNSTYFNRKELKLKYSTFEDNINKYEKDVLAERVVYKNDRGFFVEPHSNRNIDLGTASIKKFIPNLNEYNNLLFIEKTGFYEMIHNDFKLTKKYDVGLVCTQGFANNAYRDLIEKIQKEREDIKVYILTDFDIAGLSISENAKKPDELSNRDNCFNCDRIGIKLQDINKYNLEPEPVSLSKDDKTKLNNMLKDNLISQEEFDFLEVGQRVEINALDPVSLKRYLEDKFKTLGVEKVRPAKAEIRTPITKSFEEIKNNALKESIGEYILNSIQDKVFNQLKENIDLEDTGFKEATKRETIYNKIIKELKDYPFKSWEDINRQEVNKAESELRETEIKYKSKVRSQVKELMKDVNIDISFN